MNTWINVVRRARLGRTVKAVAIVLATYADPDGTRVRPGTARVAVECEITFNVAQAAMTTLRNVGLIERTSRGSRRAGGGRADTYRLILAPGLLDRIRILDPDELRAAAAAMVDKHVGSRGRLHTPTATDAPPLPGPLLHTAMATNHGPNQGSVAHGGVPTSGSVAHRGVQELHTATAITLQDPPPNPPSTDDTAVRTAVTVTRATLQEPTCPPPGSATEATPPTAPNQSGTRSDAPHAPANAKPAQTPRRRPTTRPASPPTATGQPQSQSRPGSSPPAPAATPPPPPAKTTPAAGDTPRIVYVTQDHGPPLAAELIATNPDRPRIAKIIYCHSRTSAWIATNRIIATEETAA